VICCSSTSRSERLPQPASGALLHLVAGLTADIRPASGPSLTQEIETLRDVLYGGRPPPGPVTVIRPRPDRQPHSPARPEEKPDGVAGRRDPRGTPGRDSKDQRRIQQAEPRSRFPTLQRATGMTRSGDEEQILQPGEAGAEP